MFLRTDDSETTSFLHTRPELDVRTTTGHVGGDGDGACQTRLRHDLGFALVLFRVQYVVRDLAHGEHLAHQLAHLHARGTHQHGATRIAQRVDLLDHRVVLLALGLEDHVLRILAHHRAVGGDHHHVQFVDVPQFLRFRLGRTGHTGQLVVHAEVVLKGHGGVCLRGRFHFHFLLALDGLVQSIAVAATFQDTAGLLVHDLHLAVHHHVLHVVLVQRVGTDQLVHRVDAFALDGEIA